MADLSEADLKFVLSVDPDDDALNKAIDQINAEIDRAKIAKIRLGLEQGRPTDALPASFLEQKFGKLGTALDSVLGKTSLGKIFQQITAGLGKVSAGSSPASGPVPAAKQSRTPAGREVPADPFAGLGGPLSTVVRIAKELLGVGGQLASVPFQAISAGLGSVSVGLREVQKALRTPLKIPGGGVTSPPAVASGVAGAAVGAPPPPKPAVQPTPPGGPSLPVSSSTPSIPTLVTPTVVPLPPTPVLVTPSAVAQPPSVPTASQGSPSPAAPPTPPARPPTVPVPPPSAPVGSAPKAVPPFAVPSTRAAPLPKPAPSPPSVPPPAQTVEREPFHPPPVVVEAPSATSPLADVSSELLRAIRSLGTTVGGGEEADGASAATPIAAEERETVLDELLRTVQAIRSIVSGTSGKTPSVGEERSVPEGPPPIANISEPGGEAASSEATVGRTEGAALRPGVTGALAPAETDLGGEVAASELLRAARSFQSAAFVWRGSVGESEVEGRPESAAVRETGRLLRVVEGQPSAPTVVARKSIEEVSPATVEGGAASGELFRAARLLQQAAVGRTRERGAGGGTAAPERRVEAISSGKLFRATTVGAALTRELGKPAVAGAREGKEASSELFRAANGGAAAREPTPFVVRASSGDGGSSKEILQAADRLREVASVWLAKSSEGPAATAPGPAPVRMEEDRATWVPRLAAVDKGTSGPARVPSVVPTTEAGGGVIAGFLRGIRPLFGGAISSGGAEGGPPRNGIVAAAGGEEEGDVSSGITRAVRLLQDFVAGVSEVGGEEKEEEDVVSSSEPIREPETGPLPSPTPSLVPPVPPSQSTAVPPPTPVTPSPLPPPPSLPVPSPAASIPVPAVTAPRAPLPAPVPSALPAPLAVPVPGAGGAGAAAGGAGAAAGGAGAAAAGAAGAGAAAGGAGAAAAGVAAAAGPVAIAVIAIKELAKDIGKVASIPFKAISGGLGLVAGGLREIQGPLGPIGAELDVASKGIGAFADLVKQVPIIGDLLGPMLDQLAAMPGIIKDVTTSLTAMAGKASPGIITQFTIALEDFQATVGQAFLPIVELMTHGVREFADILANLIPNTQEVKDALGNFTGAFVDLMAELKDLFVELGPLIRTGFISALRMLGTALAVTMRQVQMLVTVFRFLVEPIMSVLRLLGLVGEEDKGRTRATAARTPTMGSIEEYQRRLQLQTAGQGVGIGPASVPKDVNNLMVTVQKIADWFNRMTKEEIVRNIADGVSGLLKTGVKETLNNVEGGVRGGARAGIFGPLPQLAERMLRP